MEIGPHVTTLDAADVGLRHAVSHGYFGLRSVVGQNFEDLFFGQLGVSVAFSNLSSSVLSFVGIVVGAAIPPKVVRPAISSVAVVVSALKASRARAKKGLRD